MKPEYFGTEHFTEEDRAYKGSRFSEVQDAIFTNPYQSMGWRGRAAVALYDRNDPYLATRVDGRKRH